MKNLNLKLAGTLVLSLLTASTFAQNWRTGGNVPCPGPQCVDNTNNILGPIDNVPLRIITNNTQRMKLNGSLVTNLNGVLSHDVSGYFGIAPNGYFATNTPWSMLHLDGDNNTPYSGNGWRKWMKTGVFMKEHSDAMYVGLKQENGTNRSDAVINWSDDQTNGYF